MGNHGKKQWTWEQRAAIEADRANLLVSAAAGAGKTAVLVERVISRIMHPDKPLSLDNILVVTFTEAAAAEMRQRIGAALVDAVTKNPENEYIRRQMMLLNRSHISTIHSFCLWVLRTYFYRINLDPGFRIMDPSETELLQLEVMDRVLEEVFTAERGDGPVTELADSLGGRGDANLVDIVLKVWRFTRSLPWPDAWLEETVKMYCTRPEGTFESLPWYRYVQEVISLHLHEAGLYIKDAQKIASGPSGPAPYLENLERESYQIDRLLEDLDTLDWKELNRRLRDIEFEQLKPVRGKGCDSVLKDRTAKLRNHAKDIIKSLREIFCRDGEDIEMELERAGELVSALVGLVRRFEEVYRDAKQRCALADFSDLEHLCLQVLLDENASPGEVKPSIVALELQQRFAEVLVDEYQDINSIQDAILTLISRKATPNLFMVGDVKQSIYRFRLANPELFLEKYHLYPEVEGGDCRRINLSANFRSRAGVVHGINYIFSQIFSRLVGELEYDEEAALVARAAYPPNPDAVTVPLEFYLLEGERDCEDELVEHDGETPPGEGLETESTDAVEGMEELTAIEKEALLVARRIRQLVSGTAHKPGPECQVWDPEGEAYRDITYRDIVVLLRVTKNSAAVFLDTLRQQGIPAYAELGSGYFNALEVETVLSLLRIIDNPNQDIPLAAVLRSPIVGLSAGEMARIHLAAPMKDFFTALKLLAAETTSGDSLCERLRAFLDDLDRWRTMARRQPLGDVIWQIYRETGYLEFVGGLPGGMQRQANLRALLDRARQFENFARHGLFRFLRFIDRLRQTEGDLGAARALGENENLVRIMSIHKAKGLEFPVVFVAGLGKQFNFQDLSGDILLHGKMGLGCMCLELNTGVKYPTLPYLAMTHRLRLELLSEEMRVLYVAMTRAREKLILVGTARNLHRRAEKWCFGLQSEEKQLPAVFMTRAITPLDWICPALVRHPDMDALREMAAMPGGTIIESAASWRLQLITGSLAAALPSFMETGEREIVSDTVMLSRNHSYDYRQEVNNRLSWIYPRRQLPLLPVKLTVTDLKRRFDVFHEGEIPLRPGTGSFTRRPVFLHEKEGLTAAERGTATHFVLQHVNLRQEVSEEKLTELLERLVEREVLTPEQAAAVDLRGVKNFFDSPLGLRLLARPEKVKRELPFSLAVPVKELYPQLTQEIDNNEITLVQGIIDCLVEEEKGYLLLDFKTGRVPADPLSTYREQIDFYSRAVENIFNQPVTEAYLYFIDQGESHRVK